MKKHYRLLVVAIYVMVSFVPVNAQLDYRSGYLINEKNDTLRGYIQYRGQSTYKICTFKSNPEDKPVDYYPSDIKAYGFNEGKYYVSKNIMFDGNPKMYFLEYLIKGKASIFYIRDKNDHYFIENANGRVIELTEPDQLIEKNNGELFLKQKKYKGKLKAVLLDCQDIFPEIEKTNLTHSSLIKLAKDYHYKVCPDEQCIVFERKSKPVHVNFGIHAGLLLNKVAFGAYLSSDHNFGSLMGCRFELENLLNWTEKLTIAVDFTLHRYTNYNLREYDYDLVKYDDKLYRLYKDGNGMSYRTNLDVNLRTIALKIPVTINHTFLKGKIRPYIGGGFLNTLIITQNKKFELQRFYEVFNKSIPTHQIGLIARAGAKFKLKNNHFIYCDLNFEYTENPNINNILRFKNSSFSIQTGFAF